MRQAHLSDFEAFARDFSDTCSQDEIHSLCSKLCQHLGFDYFIYGVKFPTSFIKPHILIINGFPRDWRERYVAQSYIEIDPTVSYCTMHLTPVTWDRFKPLEERNSALAHFMDESREFGLKSGISFPVHDAQGGRAMLSLASRKDQQGVYSGILKRSPLAHALSFYIHEAVRRTVSTVEILPRCQLTERETECLRWAAEGKTSWETSRILGISERTVIFHLQNVLAKMDVSNRSHAVARAVSSGII